MKRSFFSLSGHWRIARVIEKLLNLYDIKILIYISYYINCNNFIEIRCGGLKDNVDNTVGHTSCTRQMMIYL